MAGDWVKVEAHTPEKPEVLAVAAKLGLDPEVAFAKCFKVWRWFDLNSVDGSAQSMTAVILDSLVSLPGFSQALLDVGWLQARSGSLAIPHFARHLGQSAKKRALGAKRAARHRGNEAHESNAQSNAQSNASALLTLLSSSLSLEEDQEDKGGLGGKGEKGKPRDGPACQPALTLDTNGFAAFMAVYPLKSGRRRAEILWRNLAPDAELQRRILQSVEEHQRCKRWREGFIPRPDNFLEDQCWEEKVNGQVQPSETCEEREAKVRRTLETRRQYLEATEAAKRYPSLKEVAKAIGQMPSQEREKEAFLERERQLCNLDLLIRGEATKNESPQQPSRSRAGERREGGAGDCSELPP